MWRMIVFDLVIKKIEFSFSINIFSVFGCCDEYVDVVNTLIILNLIQNTETLE